MVIIKQGFSDWLCTGPETGESIVCDWQDDGTQKEKAMTHSATKQRLRTFENLETKKLMTADIGLDIGAPSESMFEVGSASSGDSFSFGVEREMKESGEKGGTADMNIGVGELQECTVSKSMDAASAKLAQFAINGNSPGTAEIDFVEVAGGGDSAQRSGSRRRGRPLPRAGGAR